MPVNPTYPGVYIEELPSGVRTITGVSTSIAAFIDYFNKGPMNKAVQLLSMSDFEREFGGLDTKSEASYAIQQFFLNGGAEAWVVRTASKTPPAVKSGTSLGTSLAVSAINEGAWGNFIRVAIDHNTSDPANLFNMVVSQYADNSATAQVVRSEVFRNLSMDSSVDPSKGQYVVTVVNDESTGSKLIRVTPPPSGTSMPAQNGTTSGTLTDPVVLTADQPGVEVTIGSSGPLVARFAPPTTFVPPTTALTLQQARDALQAAIRAASPSDPAFAAASVEIVNGRLRVLSGPADPGTEASFDVWSEPADQAYTDLKLDVATNALRSVAVGSSAGGTVDVSVNEGAAESVSVGPFTDPGSALSALKAGIGAVADLSDVGVMLDEANHLVVVPKSPNGTIRFSKPLLTPVGDPDVVKALGLDVAVQGRMSGTLTDPFGGLTNDPATVWVTIGATTQDVQIAGIKKVGSTPAIALKTVKEELEAGLLAEGFYGAQVMLVGNQLLVLSGDSAATVTFAQFKGDAKTVDELRLRPLASPDPDGATVATQQYVLSGGKDGGKPDATALNGTLDDKTGIYALEDVDLFNILCIPRTAFLEEKQLSAVLNVAIPYCAQRRAFFIVDPPSSISDVQGIKDWLNSISLPITKDHAALYFPQVQIADPLNAYRLRPFGPSGTIAGVYAQTDGTRGVWKAPAGTDATLGNVQALGCVLTDAQNGTLNPLAINCLRNFPVYGNVCWGARTLAGADQTPNDWKYVPVRRFALFLEESLYRGTKWVVFEPNDEPLWSQIRLNIGAFMHSLFRQGAFQGTNPKDAYFVKCDNETTTQDDINKGIVNILVGFAPLKPAEFVVIQIQQMAGQIQV